MIEKKMTEQESLQIITSMIETAKNSYQESGVGPILWGSVITTCSLVTWLQIHFKYTLPFDIWLLTLIAIVPQILIVQREKRSKKVKRYDIDLLDTLWTCFGISIFLFIFINANIVAKLNPVFETYIQVKGTKPAFNYSSFTTSFFLLLYGFPTIITGSSRKFAPMLWGGILCWVCCIISVFTKVEMDMLLMAISATAAWLIPGIILYKKNANNTAHV
jgi:hypothetical protein